MKIIFLLSDCEKGTFTVLDICAVVHNTGELSTFIAKTSQREMTKRDLELVDDTNRSVRLTLWGEEVNSFCFLTHFYFC